MSVWPFIVPLVLLAGLWALLSSADPASWLVGVPAVLAGSWAVRRLAATHAPAPNLVGLLYFVPFFLWESLRGGVDVARRTLAPRLRVQPGFHAYPLQLRQSRARLLFANCVSLLPGTLTAELRDDRVDLHVLDTAADPRQELRRLEQAVERVYPVRAEHAMSIWLLVVPVAPLAGLWALLTNADPASWFVGVPAVLAGTWAVSRLTAARAPAPNLVGLLYFVPFFLWESLRGGVDVARRTLAPRLRVQPGFDAYPLRLQQPQARLLFANCVSLLPGTLTAELRDDRVDLHVLDTAADPRQALRRLEQAVERVYPDPSDHGVGP